jgi:hypothetical protein
MWIRLSYCTILLAVGCSGKNESVVIMRTVQREALRPELTPFVNPKTIREGQNIIWLKELLIGTEINSKQNVTNEFIESEFAKAPELPYIRLRCKKLFNTEAFNVKTLESLTDWLCTEYSLKPEVAKVMSLEEVVTKLKSKE